MLLWHIAFQPSKKNVWLAIKMLWKRDGPNEVHILTCPVVSAGESVVSRKL